MTEWLSYETTIDGTVALIDVDATLADPNERPDLHCALEATVKGFECDGEGLPTEDAEDALYGLEESIESLLTERGAVLAATVASAGAYQFIAYARSPDLADDVVRTARDAGLAAAVATHDDAMWQAYGRWSLSGEPLEAARDRAQLDELANVGDDLEAEHELTFDYEFDDEDAAARGTELFDEAGFDAERPEDGDVVQILVTMIPEEEEIGAVRRRLDAIAAHCGGNYGGWGTEPIDGE